MAEGQTEESFLNEIVAPDLAALQVMIDAHLITTGRRLERRYRGGHLKYQSLKSDLLRWMKGDQNADSWFTTMIDLYALPEDFPGKEECKRLRDPRQRVECLEERLAADVRAELGDKPICQRFIPYIQLHEFEALLFSDPAKFLEVFPDQESVVEQLQEIRATCGGPEHIDDGPDTAPSKRICQLLPDYQKAVSGVLIAKHIGLTVIRRECPHFDGWVAKIIRAVQFEVAS